jgi:23S rRNA (uracil1939-C5)-methyltransferase
MRRKPNRVLEAVALTDYAAGGRSLARVGGKVVFVEGAVPGDVVDVLLTRSRADWSEGRAIRHHRFSADRVEPFCAHFGVCGGCQWQMLPYGLQLAWKQREVLEQLRRIGKVDLPDLLPILGAERTTAYRNKLEFTFSNRRYLSREEMEGAADAEALRGMKDSPALGYHAPRQFDKVLDIGQCHLQAEPSNAIREWFRHHALRDGLSFYDIRAQEGFLRNLVLRSTRAGEWMVNLVTGPGGEDAVGRMLSDFRVAFPETVSLYHTVNPKRNDSLNDLEPVLIAGETHLTEVLGGLRFRIGPKSFFQTNTEQAERLYGVVRDFAGLTGEELVYDLYCGTGSIGLFLHAGARRVVGVEVVGAAVADAVENARLNGIRHAEFHVGAAEDVCTEAFVARHGRPDVIVTDPPRAGMHARLVETILSVRAPTVVYVSCNPATQARDLQLLDAAYRVTAVRPVDMFPHTHHIENVVRLTLRDFPAGAPREALLLEREPESHAN